MAPTRLLLISTALLLTGTVADALSTDGTRILDDNGQPVALHGINWFGFNTGTTMVDGIWGGPPLASDFATVVLRQKLLGFNAVRLPFSFKDLAYAAPRSFVEQCTLPTPQEIAAATTPPNQTPPSTVPDLPVQPPRTPGLCNDYLPNTTTFDRLIWVAKFYAANGFYVLVDNHLREDQTVLGSTCDWVNDWTNLAAALASQPELKGRLMIDILNEPDNFGLRWEAQPGKPGVQDLYLAAMDAIYPVAPDVLFFIQGTGQGNIYANWGDGYATDPSLITSKGLSDPRPFFNALLNKPYANQVVISPHVYGPAVTNTNTDAVGPGLFDRLSTSFGYLTQTGYNGKLFPVALGEFGSKFIDPADIEAMHDIASYLNDQGAAADGRHNPISNWFYWCWNANSGDTGGIVDDSWVTINWEKVDYLTSIGLSPWYASPGAPVLPPIPVSPPTTPPPTIPPPTTPPPTTPPPTTPPPTTPPPTTPPPSVPVPPPATPPPVAGGASCLVHAAASTPWQSNGQYLASINVYVSNSGSTVVPVPWQLTLTNGGYSSLTQNWNWNAQTISGGGVQGTATNDWEALQPGQQNTINVGFVVASANSSFAPTTAVLNGVTCTLMVQ